MAEQSSILSARVAFTTEILRIVSQHTSTSMICSCCAETNTKFHRVSCLVYFHGPDPWSFQNGFGPSRETAHHCSARIIKTLEFRQDFTFHKSNRQIKIYSEQINMQQFTALFLTALIVSVCAQPIDIPQQRDPQSNICVDGTYIFGAPRAPRNLRVTERRATRISACFDAPAFPSTCPTRYLVQYEVIQAPGAALLAAGPNNSPLPFLNIAEGGCFDLTGLQPGTRYRLTVQSIRNTRQRGDAFGGTAETTFTTRNF